METFSTLFIRRITTLHHVRIRSFHHFGRCAVGIEGFDFEALSGEGLCHHKILRHSYDFKDFPSRIMSCFWPLESLNLTVTPPGLHGIPGRLTHPVIGFLPILLSRMTGLKRLFLNLMSREDFLNPPPDYECVEACFTYDDVFLRTTRWPCLTVLHLTAISMSCKEMIRLVYHQIHDQAYLHFRDIMLLDGEYDDFSEIFESKPVESLDWYTSCSRWSIGQEMDLCIREL